MLSPFRTFFSLPFLRCLTALLPLWLGVASAQSTNPEPMPSPTADAASPAPLVIDVHPPMVDAAAYRIGPEDVLEISVWKEEGLHKEVLVRPDGRLSFPLVGELQAAGKSVGQLTQELTARLGQLITNPVVSVGVLKVSGNKIFVIGKVNNPGEFASGRYINVMQALTMAGGLNPYAKSSEILILRSVKDAGTTSLPFNYDSVIAGKKLEQNIMLQNGDVVVVP